MTFTKFTTMLKRGWPIIMMLVLASIWIVDLIGPEDHESEDTSRGFYASTEQDSGTVSISSAQSTRPGETVEVDINIEPGEAIAGAQCDLIFDPSLVTANSIQEGNLLTQGGASSYFNPGEIDNQAGIIEGVAGVIITPGQTVSTAGTFATVMLTTKTDKGIGSLTLSNVILGNASGQPVSVSVVNDNDPSTNDPPILAPIGNKLITRGETLQFSISAIDPNNDALSYTAINLPIGALFYSSNQTFSWTPSTIGVYNNIQFRVTDGEFVDSENITIIVAAAENTGGGGAVADGGGSAVASGGGGAAAGGVVVGNNSSNNSTIPVHIPDPTPDTTTNAPQPIPSPEPPESTINEITPFSTVIDVATTSSGVVAKTINHSSNDGNWQLTIPEGTRNLNPDGTTVEQITVTEMVNPPTPPTDSYCIGTTYDFGPDGATFDPPITLSLTYDDSTLPTNVDENDLVIATWDEASSTWTYLSSTIDSTANTISSPIGHFSAYTIMAPVDFDASIATSITADVSRTPDSSNPSDETILEESRTPVMNWAVLGEIIGIAVFLSLLAAITVLIRRRRLIMKTAG